MKKIINLKKLFVYTSDKKLKEELENRMIRGMHRYHVAALVLIAVLQAGMFLRNIFGGETGGYRDMYLFLLISTLFCLLVILKSCTGQGLHRRRYLAAMAFFMGALSFWSCGVAYEDFLRGGNDISAFSYAVMGMAAFMIVQPWISYLIYLGAFCLLNLTIYFEVLHRWEASVLINSASTVVLAALVTAVTYRTKAQNIERQITNEKQVTEIQIMNRELHRQAYTDSLTGLYNRRYLEERQCDQLCWGDSRTAVMMIDIDNFKLYNDFYGHQKGDECLERIADMIRRFIEGEDAYAVRYGGEEFLICYSHCRRGDIWSKAEKLRKEMISLNIKREDIKDRYVTISIGVSEADEKITMEELILHSDMALYEAKNNGKNQVKSYKAG